MKIIVVQVRNEPNDNIVQSGFNKDKVNIYVQIHYHITSFDLKTPLNLKHIAQNRLNVEYFHEQMVISYIILYIVGFELEGFKLLIFNKSNKIRIFSSFINIYATQFSGFKIF